MEKAEKESILQLLPRSPLAASWFPEQRPALLFMPLAAQLPSPKVVPLSQRRLGVSTNHAAAVGPLPATPRVSDVDVVQISQSPVMGRLGAPCRSSSLDVPQALAAILIPATAALSTALPPVLSVRQSASPSEDLGVLSGVVLATSCALLRSPPSSSSSSVLSASPLVSPPLFGRRALSFSDLPPAPVVPARLNSPAKAGPSKAPFHPSLPTAVTLARPLLVAGERSTDVAIPVCFWRTYPTPPRISYRCLENLQSAFQCRRSNCQPRVLNLDYW
ncbi:hypothetical protein Q4I28_006543 [Leishmania naiffi]|uniref:Uncharacterized protein n=1 Tax=Leishmania naiffi TaxID=5678 RepID=A0AAW3BCZ1_9TRYP